MTRISAIAAAAALAVSAAGIASAQAEPSRQGGDALDFKAIDTDGNGSLGRAELQARAVARLGRADTDGDGWLDREELIAIVPARDGARFRIFTVDPAEAMVDRLLALMGATETGRVEVSVLADRRVNMLLAAVDTDRDAAISQAEADARAEARMHRREHRHHGDRPGDREWRGGPGWGPQGGPGWDPHGSGRDGDGPGPRGGGREGANRPAPGALEEPAAPPAPAPDAAPGTPPAEPAAPAMPGQL